MGATGQLAGPHPPRPVTFDQGHEVGTSRLPELPGHSANGRPNGRSRGRWNGRSHRFGRRVGRSRGRSCLVSRRGLDTHGLCKGAESDRRADVEHPLDLPVRQPEGRSSVGHVIELLPIGSDLGVGARTQRRSPPRRALGSDEPFVGVRVPTSQNRCEVRPQHRPREPGTVSSATEPPPRLLPAIRVVPLGTTSVRRWSAARRGGLRRRLEVAHDRVHHTRSVPPASAQRSDRELHRRPPTGDAAGFPEGNLQMCARRICCSAPMNGTGPTGVPGEPFRRVKLIARAPCPEARARWLVGRNCSGCGRDEP